VQREFCAGDVPFRCGQLCDSLVGGPREVHVLGGGWFGSKVCEFSPLVSDPKKWPPYFSRKTLLGGETLTGRELLVVGRVPVYHANAARTGRGRQVDETGARSCFGAFLPKWPKTHTLYPHWHTAWAQTSGQGSRFKIPTSGGAARAPGKPARCVQVPGFGVQTVPPPRIAP